MKKYEAPELIVVAFASEVIAAEDDTSRVPGEWDD